MKFLADEGVEGLIVQSLRDAGFDTLHIMEMVRGITDEEVLAIAKNEDRILITRDKDFGELVFLLGKLHAGIILNRLAGLKTEKKVELLLEVLDTYADELYGSFTVIQPSNVRIRKMRK